MIILIFGATHTGKTLLAQKILEKYKFTYLSIDHLKMGFIRSKKVKFKVQDDDKIESYLWPILVEIIKTNIENKQNLVIEGCYIPFDWKDSFNNEYIHNIKYICLIMSKNYIVNNFKNIVKFESVIENRKYKEDIDIQELIKENKYNLDMCKKYNNEYILIDDEYNIDNYKV